MKIQLIIIGLLFPIISQAQLTKRDVVANGGTISTSKNYSNLSVVGEAVVAKIGEDPLHKSYIGFIFDPQFIATDIHPFDLNSDVLIHLSENQVNIQLEHKMTGSVQITLIDIKGSLVLTKELHKHSKSWNTKVKFPEIATGVYILRLELGKYYTSKKLIIN